MAAGVVTGNSTNVGEAASPTLEFSRFTYITGGQLMAEAPRVYTFTVDSTFLVTVRHAHINMA
jgi:hypothetical protein